MMEGKDTNICKKTTHPFVGRDSYKEACQQ
jgi:hypothetical protein